MPAFIDANNIQPFISQELKGVLNPIDYIDKNEKVSTGYDATILPQMCKMYLDARQAKALKSQQLPLARASEILLLGLSNIGIIALVDEATGYQHGDEFGKREGIDPDRVLALVEKSLKHLIIYSTHVRGFSFTKIDGSAIDPQKTVLQEEIDGMVLNVVIKAHLIDIHTFEITIITAMCVDDFRIFDGQYVIDIHGNTSTLLRKESKKMLEICSI